MENSLLLFWTEPPLDQSSQPTDPLGLDAMRDELADKLVPCLTGRTKSHEDFYWTLVFIKWASQQPTEEARIREFLRYERYIKLTWAHAKRTGFIGVIKASEQANSKGAPKVAYTPLLKNQRSQGLLGAHLGPLQKLGLVKDLQMTTEGDELIKGAGQSITGLRDGDWRQWMNAFRSTEKGYGVAFKRRFQQRLAERMPLLRDALQHCRWNESSQWGKAAHVMASSALYARLAGEYCSWADEMKRFFQEAVLTQGRSKQHLPPRLKASIPGDLGRFDPLRRVLCQWGSKDPFKLLAEWHRNVYEARGYSTNDLWVLVEDGKYHWYPGRVASSDTDGSDCRWKNAVMLMKPISGER